MTADENRTGNEKERRRPSRANEPWSGAGGVPEWHAPLRIAAGFLRDLECGAVITDRAGDVRWINAALCLKLGYDSAEQLAYSPSFRPFGEHTGRSCAAMWGAVLGGRVWDGRVFTSAPDGARRPVALLVTRLASVGGEQDHFLALHAWPENREEVAEAQKAMEEVLAIWRRAIGDE